MSTDVGDTPNNVAREVFGITGSGVRPLSWEALADLAAEKYWQNRPQPSAHTHAEHLRRRLRQTTPVEVWQHRAGVT